MSLPILSTGSGISHFLEDLFDISHRVVWLVSVGWDKHKFIFVFRDTSFLLTGSPESLNSSAVSFACNNSVKIKCYAIAGFPTSFLYLSSVNDSFGIPGIVNTSVPSGYVKVYPWYGAMFTCLSIFFP